MSTSNKPRSSCGIQRVEYRDILAVLLAWGLGFLVFYTKDTLEYPFVVDSASYYQAATNFLHGKGLMHWSQGPETLDQRLYPLQLWPPGYSVLIAAATRLGVDAHIAAIWIPRVAWLCAAPLLLLLYRLLGLSFAAGPLMVLCVLSPGVVGIAGYVLSDAPFFALALACLVLFAMALKPRAFGWVMCASGMLASIAYSVRNVGLSLIIAIPATLVLLLAVRKLAPRDAVRLLAQWIGGLLPIVIILKLRCFLVFGNFEPYSMRTSTLSPIKNIRWMMYGILNDITGLRDFSLGVSWNYLRFIALAVLGSLVTVRLISRWFRDILRNGPMAQIGLGVAVTMYCALGMLVVIAARSTYEWGEVISERHAGQYNCLWLGLLAAACEMRFHARRARFRVSLIVIICGLLLTRGLICESTWHSEQDAVLRVATDTQVIDTLQKLPANAVVVSNQGTRLTVITGRWVPQLCAENDVGAHLFLPSLEKVRKSLPAERPLYVAIVDTRVAIMDPDLNGLGDEYHLVMRRAYFRLFMLGQLNERWPTGREAASRE